MKNITFFIILLFLPLSVMADGRLNFNIVDKTDGGLQYLCYVGFVSTGLKTAKNGDNFNLRILQESANKLSFACTFKNFKNGSVQNWGGRGNCIVADLTDHFVKCGFTIDHYKSGDTVTLIFDRTPMSESDLKNCKQLTGGPAYNYSFISEGAKKDSICSFW